MNQRFMHAGQITLNWVIRGWSHPSICAQTVQHGLDVSSIPDCERRAAERASGDAVFAYRLPTGRTDLPLIIDFRRTARHSSRRGPFHFPTVLRSNRHIR